MKHWRWTRADIARELGMDVRTVGKKLVAAELDGVDGLTTRQVFAAMVGDLTAERTREAKERADKLALENAEKRRELVPAREYIRVMSKCLESIKATIVSAANLETEDKDKILAACREGVAGLLGCGGGSASDPESTSTIQRQRVG